MHSDFEDRKGLRGVDHTERDASDGNHPVKVGRGTEAVGEGDLGHSPGVLPAVSNRHKEKLHSRGLGSLAYAHQRFKAGDYVEAERVTWIALQCEVALKRPSSLPTAS